MRDITRGDVSTGQGTAQDLDAGCPDCRLDPTPPPDQPVVFIDYRVDSNEVGKLDSPKSAKNKLHDRS